MCCEINIKHLEIPVTTYALSSVAEATLMPKFLKGELVIFVGHSHDAHEEAKVVYSLEAAFQRELKSRLARDENPPFTSVKSVGVE
jgi:hypothetical protein